MWQICEGFSEYRGVVYRPLITEARGSRGCTPLYKTKTVYEIILIYILFM